MGWIGDHSGHLGEEKLVRLVYLTFDGGSGGRWEGGGWKVEHRGSGAMVTQTAEGAGGVSQQVLPI